VALTRWVGKVAALLHCSFREVLLLDSDNLPLLDPAYLFQDPLYQQHGNLFWPDFWSNWVKAETYPWLGLNKTVVQVSCWWKSPDKMMGCWLQFRFIDCTAQCSLGACADTEVITCRGLQRHCRGSASGSRPLHCQQQQQRQLRQMRAVLPAAAAAAAAAVPSLSCAQVLASLAGMQSLACC
jgi:hypothetical protein